jgi:hypothetical protein
VRSEREKVLGFRFLQVIKIVVDPVDGNPFPPTVGRPRDGMLYCEYTKGEEHEGKKRICVAGRQDGGWINVYPSPNKAEHRPITTQWD